MIHRINDQQGKFLFFLFLTLIAALSFLLPLGTMRTEYDALELTKSKTLPSSDSDEERTMLSTKFVK